MLFPVCTPAYRDAHRIRTPGDLRRCRLLRHAWQPWQPWLRAARLRIKEPAGQLTVSDTAMLLEAAAAGEGVALARSLFAADDLGRGRLVRLFDIAVEDAFAYYLTWHQGAPLSPAGVGLPGLAPGRDRHPAAQQQDRRWHAARKARRVKGSCQGTGGRSWGLRQSIMPA